MINHTLGKGRSLINLKNILSLIYLIFIIWTSPASANINHINGYAAEDLMVTYFKQTGGWKSLKGQVGTHGIDGLFYTTNKNGVIKNLMFVESKYNTSQLGKNLKCGNKQMSKTWLICKIDELITDCEIKRNETDLTKYNEIRRMGQANNYRSRLWEQKVENGKLKITISKLHSSDSNVVKLPLTGPEKPKIDNTQNTEIDLKNPKGKFQNRIVNNYYNSYKKALLQSGGFSPKEADIVLNEMRKNPTTPAGDIIKKYRPETKLKLTTKQLSKLPSVHEGMLNKIKNPNLRTAARAGVMSSLPSGFFNIYSSLIDEMSIYKAIGKTIEDSSLSFSSMYIAEAVIQNVGNGRYAMTVITNKSTASIVTQVTGAFLNYGVATFIFDETICVWNYVQANIDSELFFKETGKNLFKSLASGSASYCTVLLGATPGSFIVIGVAIGSYLLVSKFFDNYIFIQESNYSEYNAVMGKLPLELQNKQTPWNYQKKNNMDESVMGKLPEELKNKRTPWNYEKRNDMDESVMGKLPEELKNKKTPWSSQE